MAVGPFSACLRDAPPGCSNTRISAATMMTCEVTMIVLNRNRAFNTPVCLHVLMPLDYAAHRVMVIEHSSVDHSVHTLQRKHPGATLVATWQNLGYAGGSDVGILAPWPNLLITFVPQQQPTVRTRFRSGPLLTALDGDPGSPRGNRQTVVDHPGIAG